MCIRDRINEKEKQDSERELSEKQKKEIEQLKTKMDAFKKSIVKKFPFIDAIGLIPPQAAKMFEEDEQVAKIAEKEKLMHLAIVLPDDKEKDLAKVKIEAIKMVEHIKPKIWLHVILTKDIWEMGSDGKYDMVEAIGISMPLHDKGILGALRVASIHKSLCLRKFERYIVSYVIAGSLVRGEATKTSDVDVWIVVDDTDVKRMTRAELRDKLRGIIYGYMMEAADLAGVKNKLSPQVYILTEFWDGLREANPVFFTFVRDGVPLYDRGTFTPWKQLLKMGKITGTPEAIEKFLTIGEKVGEIVERKFMDIAVEDIYWSVLTPSQGALMLYGLAPPTSKETVRLMKEIFYEKEKLIEKKYIDFVEHVIIDIYKGYEHGKFKKISGAELDELVKGTKDYIERIKKLVEEVGKKTAEQTVIKLYHDIMGILIGFFGKVSESQLIKKFQDEMIETGRMPASYLKILNEVIKAHRAYETKGKEVKVSREEVERIRKDAQILIANLMEYHQRYRIFDIEKLRFAAKIGGSNGEIYILNKIIFIIPDLQNPEMKKFDVSKGTIEESSPVEFEETLKQPRENKGEISKEIIEKLEKALKKKIELLV